MPEAESLGQVVGGLRDELLGLREDITAYAAKSVRDQRVLRLLLGSVTFDILLSVGLFFGIHKADSAARAAARASSTQVVNCRSGNVARQTESELWNYVLGAFPPPANETPEAKKQREDLTAQFKTYIANAFAQRDCDHLGGN